MGEEAGSAPSGNRVEALKKEVNGEEHSGKQREGRLLRSCACR